MGKSSCIGYYACGLAGSSSSIGIDSCWGKRACSEMAGEYICTFTNNACTLASIVSFLKDYYVDLSSISKL